MERTAPPTESSPTSSGNGDVKEKGQAKAKEVAGKAQEQMSQATQQARGRLREQVDQRSTQAGERVRAVAGDTRSVAQELRSQGKDAPARYAEQAADRVERVGDWLHDSDGDRILGDVEDFARRNPWGVAAAGLALGFAAARMLKASSAERYEHRIGEPPGLAGGPPPQA
jgi:ABC-type transporter Mla subunit MlaD